MTRKSIMDVRKFIYYIAKGYRCVVIKNLVSLPIADRNITGIKTKGKL